MGYQGATCLAAATAEPTPGSTPTPTPYPPVLPPATAPGIERVMCEKMLVFGPGEYVTEECPYTFCTTYEDPACDDYFVEVVSHHEALITEGDPGTLPDPTIGGGVRVGAANLGAGFIYERYLPEGDFYDARVRDAGKPDDQKPILHAWGSCTGWYGGQACGAGWALIRFWYYTDDFADGTPTPTPTATPLPGCWSPCEQVYCEDNEADLRTRMGWGEDDYPELPSFEVLGSTCFTVPSVPLPLTDADFPGAEVCFERVAFGELDLGFYSLSVDLLAGALSAFILWRWLRH